MSLTVRDLLKLPTLRKLTLVAGETGLDNFVTSAAIVDYEYAEGVDADVAFDRESIVVTSFLFALRQPQRLLPAMQDMHARGICAVAYKTTVFQDLPAEVLAYAEEVGMPIFSFEAGIYYENIVFEVLDAIRTDDAAHIPQDTIRLMLHGTLPQAQLRYILHHTSMKFRSHIRGVYLWHGTSDLAESYRKYTAFSGLTDKLLLCRFERGLFAITTADTDQARGHQLVLRQCLDILGLDPADLRMAASEVHPAGEFPLVFRESYHCHLASLCSGTDYTSFREIGSFRFLIPYAQTEEARQFVRDFFAPIEKKPDFLQTVTCLYDNGGDIKATALEMGLHHSTVRYRLARLKEQLYPDFYSDQAFLNELFLAVSLQRLEETH